MTTDEQELLYIATVARDSGFRRVEVDPNDVIALLRRVEQLEREAAFADKKLGQHVERTLYGEPLDVVAHDENGIRLDHQTSVDVVWSLTCLMKRSQGWRLVALAPIAPGEVSP